MKKITAVLLCVLFGWSYGNAGTERTTAASSERGLVEEVLQAMVSGKTLSVSRYIAPGYLRAYGVKGEDYTLNTYSPVSYSIDNQLGNGVFEARIWGDNRSWVHRLYFMVIKDGSSFYLMPGKAPSEYMYIDSWIRVEAGIKENTYGNAPSIEESQARKLVENILYDMTNRSGSFGTEAHKYLAPSYYKKNYVSSSAYTVNYYSPKGYKIISFSPDGTIVSEVWGADRSWVHELTFKVVVENSTYYAMPGGHTDNKYIHPWSSTRTNINKETTPAKDEKTELVETLMDRMTYNKDGFGTDMILYIAPSYFKKYNLDPFSYKVNAYTPYGYSIVKNDGYGNIVVNIWGQDRSWTQELTFKVVRENDLWYLLPGEHHSGTQYVDPWYSTRSL
jgi:hypothetical protein